MRFLRLCLTCNLSLCCRLVLGSLQQQWYRKCQSVQKSRRFGARRSAGVLARETIAGLYVDAFQNG